MKNIDLRDCMAGDILISRLGAILVYIGETPYKHCRYLDHVVRYITDGNGGVVTIESLGTRTHDGFVMGNEAVRKPSIDHDIVAVYPMSTFTELYKECSKLQTVNS